MKTYLIDYEMIGSIVVTADNPQAAAARAQRVLRAVAKGLNEEGELDMTISVPVDVAKKIAAGIN